MKDDILTLLDLDVEDFDVLIDRSLELKRRYLAGIVDRPLQGKVLGLIFDKPSTRTRVSFEAAMVQLGGVPIFLNVEDTQLIRNEPIGDTGRVLSGYLDGIVVRTYSQDLLQELAAAADIPVINGLTDMYHPCQILSDLLTIKEKKGSIYELKIAWVGDGNNVAHSWLNAASILGLSLVMACPDGYQPNREVLARSLERAGNKIKVTDDPEEAVRDADVIYTDVWASMGQEGEHSFRRKIFKEYQVNASLVAKAKSDVMVMHCLPAHRGEEITADVLEGPNSVVWDQAENKLHMHKAILERLIK
nr:ornithine carbamoyltransferase [Desulfobacterales bacterium]